MSFGPWTECEVLNEIRRDLSNEVEVTAMTIYWSIKLLNSMYGQSAA